MTWLFQSDTVLKAVRHVDNDILKWHVNNVAYPDSSEIVPYEYGTIFNNRTGLTQLLSRKDAAYFAEQINSQRRNKWNLKNKRIRLYDTVELVNNRLETILFSYSLPLISINGKYAVIVEAFYCGLVCGGGYYNLYERQEDNTWRKVKSFNEWAE
ncbi:hypothetical protein [Flavisolibacter nicotianae]|uniref:hypothetical protein n=1 Tax=Flavisolibacter nicotianae TaxID=2364882 RepID=UPI0013C41C86|nr:hypothetical protein [Flavisolibacter nicotianae]